MFKQVWLRISPIQRIAQTFQLNFSQKTALQAKTLCSTRSTYSHAYDNRQLIVQCYVTENWPKYTRTRQVFGAIFLENETSNDIPINLCRQCIRSGLRLPYLHEIRLSAE